MGKKAALIVMDGWGHGKQDDSNAIYLADTPFIDSLYTGPNAELRTDGKNVGLPEGQMGNSEVGHLNIGAGRIVYQDLQKINLAIEDGSLAKNENLLKAIELANGGKRLHLMGLLSDGGVHSSQTHLHALVDICHAQGVKDICIHAFMDGRDTDPEHGVSYVRELQNHLQGKGAHLVSMVGRYYAMDRDKRWERIKKAYDLLVHGRGKSSDDAIDALQESYSRGVTDEFLEPVILDPERIIAEGDVVICFNFRTDRCREITQVLTQQDMPDHGMQTVPLEYFTMTRYDETFKGIEVFFTKDNLKDTLGEVVSRAGSSQVRIAETEKYPHVTFFFSGGREEPYDGEERIMVNSPKVATYDMQPEMSALEVTDRICTYLKEKGPDLVVLNFANPDMVGHTGVQEAVIKAVETTDSCVKRVVETGKELGYEFIIIADHGNAELNRLPDGSAHTAHTLNPVPIFYIGESYTTLDNGILADIAPSLLAIMEIAQPSAMTGRNLMS
ncbi:MAG: 2,3-bisphosphoglycerate-independent phosphoglycerate mutase [Flavobacteriales bacterium]|nr:2,3-bisphosphoglycerate-independent phosphoglycerate mutase [Flavobacteriales bacterium]